MPTWEQGVAHVELCQDAAKAPHVNLTPVREAHDDLRAAVEAALHVGVHALVDKAAAAKVNDLDCRALGLHQQDVLWLQVTVDQVVLAQEPKTKRAGKQCMAQGCARYGFCRLTDKMPCVELHPVNTLAVCCMHTVW